MYEDHKLNYSGHKDQLNRNFGEDCTILVHTQVCWKYSIKLIVGLRTSVLAYCQRLSAFHRDDSKPIHFTIVNSQQSRVGASLKGTTSVPGYHKALETTQQFCLKL